MFYTRCAYVGQHTKDQKRMHGRGIFTFADGNKYVGTFHNGMFHGQGIIFFTPANGGGQFRGTWDMGKSIQGEYIFKDGLLFAPNNWGHCTDDDRRFWHEYLTFVQPPSSAVGPAVTPDYSTSDGIPPTFANGKPRSIEDVDDVFWSAAEPPLPEHAFVADPRAPVDEDMATIIAKAKP